MSIPRIPAFAVAFLLWGATAYSQQRIDVRVDPRIELLSVTQILADYGSTGLLANLVASGARPAPLAQAGSSRQVREAISGGHESCSIGFRGSKRAS